MTVQHLHSVKYPCDYRTDNCNPICPGIKGSVAELKLFFRLQLNSDIQKVYAPVPTCTLWVPVFTAFKLKSRLFMTFREKYRLNSLF